MNGESAAWGHALPARHSGQVFFQRAEQLGARTFLKIEKGARFEEISWRDFGARVQGLMLGLCGLGLAPGETVAIIGENSVPWMCADLATLAAGWTNVVISPTLSDFSLARILSHAECRAAFVQDAAGAGRLLNLKAQLPRFEYIIVMEGGAPPFPDALSMERLIERGLGATPAALRRLLESVHPNDLATIMYTSGSTGEPKGVMRTQDNLLSNITNGRDLALSKPEDLFIIVLSLNHLFGRFGFLKSVAIGRTTAVLEGTELHVDLEVVRSLAGTSMAVVPRVMERIWKAILGRGQNRSAWEELERLDGAALNGTASERERRRMDDLRAALRRSVRDALGGRIKYITYGGAAMPPRIMRFFDLVDLPLIGSYGSTECGGVTLCGIGENGPGNLGKPFSNVQVRIAGDGEILVRGPTVTPGYFKDPAATRAAIDEEGWFYTGDLGVLEGDGSLRLVGRKKDVFNCSDGSNIYPGFIELQLENEPFVRQAILVGDQRPFIGALVVPDREQIARALKREACALSDAEIALALWTPIERINDRLESYEQIRRIAVLRDDFPSEVRSVNAFQKINVNRKRAAELYGREIEKLYSGSPEGDAK